MNCVHEYRSTLCYGQFFIFKIVLWFYSLDEILGRGLYSGEITEIFGLSGVGKSQVANLKLYLWWKIIFRNLVIPNEKSLSAIYNDINYVVEKFHFIFWKYVLLNMLAII